MSHVIKRYIEEIMATVVIVSYSWHRSPSRLFHSPCGIRLVDASRENRTTPVQIAQTLTHGNVGPQACYKRMGMKSDVQTLRISTSLVELLRL